jgi:hypothetical protein
MPGQPEEGKDPLNHGGVVDRRDQTSAGSAASIRFNRSIAERKRGSATFRYCAGSQARAASA